jgi:peptidoglycan/LPS O-acetylase OafA/YrhL
VIKPLDKLLTRKWVLFIGRISYGIYIYHILVLHLFNEYVFWPIWNKIDFDKLGYFSRLEYNETLIKFPFITGLTIGIAYLSFRYIESPILKFKHTYIQKNLSSR